MFVLLVEIDVKPGCEKEIENVLRALVDAARREAGTVFYAVQRPENSSNTFVLYELYMDRSAWQTHLQNRPVQQALQQFEVLLEVPPKITFCETLVATLLG